MRSPMHCMTVGALARLQAVSAVFTAPQCLAGLLFTRSHQLHKEPPAEMGQNASHGVMYMYKASPMAALRQRHGEVHCVPCTATSKHWPAHRARSCGWSHCCAQPATASTAQQCVSRPCRRRAAAAVAGVAAAPAPPLPAGTPARRPWRWGPRC